MLGAACSSFTSGSQGSSSSTSSSSSSSSSGSLPDGGGGNVDDAGGDAEADGGGSSGLSGCRSQPFKEITELPLPSGISVTSFRMAGQRNAYVATPDPESKLRTYPVNVRGEPQGEAMLMNIPQAPAIQNHPFAAEGETVLYFQGRANGTTRIWRSTRATAAAPWGDAETFSIVGSDDLLEPYYAGNTLYFGLRSGSDPEKIARVSRVGQTWGTNPIKIDEINGNPGDENGFPVVSEDELEIFFMSKRTGFGDLYHAFRRKKTEPFSNVEAVKELNGIGGANNDEERPAFLSLDSCTLFLTISKVSGFSVYRAVR